MFRPSLTAALLLSLLLAGCEEPPQHRGPAGPETSDAVNTRPRMPAPEAVRTLLAERSQATCESVTALHHSARDFLENPQAASLVRARQAWKQAHLDFQRLSLAYWQAGLTMPQINNDRDPIDAFPMLPGYLDRVPGYPRSGIVYSEVPLTPRFLREEHQSIDFYYLTLGFHPVETLLWGASGRESGAQAERFIASALPESDRVDARSRRIELLRLVTNSLNNRAGELCAGPSHDDLLTALAQQSGNAPVVASQSGRVIERRIGEPLDRWQAYPSGEDRNGMPVWHSPMARTDFLEMQMQIEDLASGWLPGLLDQQGPHQDRVEAVRSQLQAVAARLKTHHADADSQSREQILATRSALNEALVSLSALALASGPAAPEAFVIEAAESEKSGE